MRQRSAGVPLVLMVVWNLTSCQGTATKTAVPTPEPEQVIRESLKELYMAASAAAPQSTEQQKLILRMAKSASNGKELLLVMRAAVGVFPTDTSSPDQSAANQVRSTLTAKMIQVATLGQLGEFEGRYSVDPSSARPFVQRMIQLAGDNSDPHVWYRIRLVAAHLKLSDLESQAQARGDELARR
jgi:hypothetical protein